MRLTNYPIGVPFESLHWGKENIQIPHVISRQKLIGEMGEYQKRTPGSEFRLVLKYFNDNDLDCKKRLFKVVDELVDKKNISILSNDELVSRFLKMIEEDDLSNLLHLTGVLMRIISIDGRGTFSKKLMRENGGMIVSSLFCESRIKKRVSDNRMTRETAKMVMANGLCIIGNVIPFHNVKSLIVPPILGRIRELTIDGHEGVRVNAVFCLREMIEKDPDMFFHIDDCLDLLMKAAMDEESNVQEEGLRAIQFLLEEDLIPDDDILLEREPLFDELSRSMDPNVSRIAENILYEFVQKGLIEEKEE